MDQMEFSPILDFLVHSDRRYLTELQDIRYSQVENLNPGDTILYRVEEITYEEEAPHKEALENVLSATRIPGVNFLYLLVGDSDGVRFYYGLSRDRSEDPSSWLSIPEIGQGALQSSLLGNFRGSRMNEVTPEEKDKVFKKLRSMDLVSRIEGVAGTTKDDEAFQSVDRLVDVMQGEKFCLLIIAKALQPLQIEQIEHQLYEAYSELSPYAKVSRQQSESEGVTQSISHTEGSSETQSTSESKSKSSSESNSNGKNTSYSKNRNQSSESGGTNSSTSKSTSNSSQSSTSDSSGKSKSKSNQEGSSKGSSSSSSREHLNKSAQEWIKYCDDIIFPRLDYGRGKGVFTSAFYVMSKSKITQMKLENTVLSLYTGKQGNRVPLRAFALPKGSKQREQAMKFQIPTGRFTRTPADAELLARSILSQNAVPNVDFSLGNWITTNELSMIAGLPRKEVVGLRLREEVEFGLNFKRTNPNHQIKLGCLVQSGNEMKKVPVGLDKGCLDKHIFVAGVTGSGKTTTCHRILLESDLPFLVIEPAKTEYRILKKTASCEDLLVFTLGNNDVAPFRLNPLEFFPEESIASHVDMIKASIEAAFDMEAAIPQLIEQALYRCYEKRGWNVRTNTNQYFAGRSAFAPESNAFPTFSDLLYAIPEVVKEQGFDARLQNDYIGSIKARLQSLVAGSKGLMLDTARSVDFDALLDKKVVFELESIKNGSEKALIMGFILAAFNEAVRERYLRDRKPHPHILLVEEAHRLLSKYTPGDSPNKKQGVETFADMLAEIRKYGECLVIVDQIPNKLMPDVLKNTNTKIVHRIFAQDDKDAIGNTMALSEEQRRFLSSLETGRAIVFSEGFGQALQVQVERITDTSNIPLEDGELSARVFAYYTEESERSVFLPIHKEFRTLSPEFQQKIICFWKKDIPIRIFADYKKEGWNASYAEILQDLIQFEIVDYDMLVEWCILHYLSAGSDVPAIREILHCFLRAYPEGKAKTDATGITHII